MKSTASSCRPPPWPPDNEFSTTAVGGIERGAHVHCPNCGLEIPFEAFPREPGDEIKTVCPNCGKWRVMVKTPDRLWVSPWQDAEKTKYTGLMT